MQRFIPLASRLLTGLLVVIPVSAAADSVQTTKIDGLLERSQIQAANQKPVTRHVIAQSGVESVPALRRDLKHPNWRVRKAAAIALGKLGAPAKTAVPELTAALRDQNNEVIKVAIDALGNIGAAAAPAVPAMIKHLTASLYSDSSMAQRVMSALIKIAQPAIPTLIGMLDSRFDNVTRSALWTLGGIGKPAVPSLIQALQSPKKWVRWGAAIALRMGETARDAVPSLIERLTNQQNGERDGFVRSEIIETLGVNHIEAPTVVPVLIQLLPHPAAKINSERFCAISAFSRFVKN